jgi:hypothetical protein
LIVVCGIGLAQRHYLFHRFFNGRGVFRYQLRSQLVIVNTTGSLGDSKSPKWLTTIAISI